MSNEHSANKLPFAAGNRPRRTFRIAMARLCTAKPSGHTNLLPAVYNKKNRGLSVRKAP